MFLGFWPFGNILCKAVVSIDYYNMFTSTFTLTVMSMDRYVAVCHPVKALDMRTPHKAKVRKTRTKFMASVSARPAVRPAGSPSGALLFRPSQVVNICVWVLASAFGVPAMVMGNVEEEQEHNSKWSPGGGAPDEVSRL